MAVSGSLLTYDDLVLTIRSWVDSASSAAVSDPTKFTRWSFPSIRAGDKRRRVDNAVPRMLGNSLLSLGYRDAGGNMGSRVRALSTRGDWLENLS